MLDELLDLAARRRRAIALPLTFAVLAAVFPQRVFPQVNTEELLSLTGSQPALAADVRGGFVTLWTDTEAENEGLGIRGCLLAPKKGGCGPHFAVNTTALGDQVRPAVAADDPGRFVVAWQGPAENGTAVFGQRFGAGGVKLGPELVLSGPDPGSQQSPRVAMAEGGAFLAAWQNAQENRIEIARFSAKGKPLGAAVPVEMEGETGEGDPAVHREVLVGGHAGFLAIFAGPDGHSAQRYSASGAVKGGRFPIADRSQCESGEGACESVAAAGMDSRGRFVVIWEITGNGTGSNLFAQLFTPGGKARTERIPVNATPSLSLESPAVALADDGNVLVAWTRTDTLHPERTGLFLRRMRLQ